MPVRPSVLVLASSVCGAALAAPAGCPEQVFSLGQAARMAVLCGPAVVPHADVSDLDPECRTHPAGPFRSMLEEAGRRQADSVVASAPGGLRAVCEGIAALGAGSAPERR